MGIAQQSTILFKPTDDEGNWDLRGVEILLKSSPAQNCLSDKFAEIVIHINTAIIHPFA